MSKWTEGLVTQIRHYTDHLFSLKLTANIAPFTAGQFTKLSLTSANETVQRAFSFVNAPDAAELEFFIVSVTNGALSPQLAKLTAGDHVKIYKEPSGYFTLNEIPNTKRLWMIATGTGISPYLSILQSGQQLERFDNIILIHGVRYQQDLVYQPLMQQLAQQYSGKLQIATIVSRERVHNSLYGRIPALIQSHQLEEKVGHALLPQQSHVMLCGNPAMIQETQQILKERQFRRHLRRHPGQITSEQYW